MARKKTVLVVVAHADDMEFTAAGTIARLIDEFGYNVYQYILTDNSKGSYRLAPRELIAISAREAVEAGEVLGLKEVRLDRYADGELNLEQPNVLREKIMRMIREVKADIVMSWDPFAPYEDHPDHRVCSMATLDAAAFSGNPLFHPEHPFEPYSVTEAYWFAKSPWNAELVVDITTTMDKKIEALLKHDCQMVLTVDAIVRQAQALGASVPALENLPPDGHKAIIDAGMRMVCARVGATKGYAYGELFRYQKFGMLDLFLGTNYVACDFA